jgi:hypothetical protein
MVKVLMIMQHIILCTPSIAFVLVSHTCIFVMTTQSKDRRNRRSQHKVEDTNPEQEQSKPRCI